MSLGKAKTRIKEGVKELQSVVGLKRVGMNLGIGVAVGSIVDLILCYIFLNFIDPAFVDEQGHSRAYIQGFGIYPNRFYTKADGTKVSYCRLDDIILIIATVAMLISRKFWFVIGFFLGWYFTGYTELYKVLGLPIPEGIGEEYVYC